MSEKSIRNRAVPYKGSPATSETWWEFNGVRYSYEARADVLAGTQQTVSEGNQISLLGKSDDDIGSDFYTTKVEILDHGIKKKLSVGSFQDTYSGIMGAVSPNGTYPPDLSSSTEALEAFGSTAISRVSPVSPQSNLLTSLIELRNEGLPSLPGRTQWENKTKAARGAGGEYLNTQFGWVPLVSDISAAIDATRNSEKLIKQLLRDNGRNVRRQYRPPHVTNVETTTVESGDARGIPWGPGNLAQTVFYTDSRARGTLVRERITTQKRWFSGCFTYHIPLGDDTISRITRSAQEANRLYGVALTPEVVWNVTPWSWATDWFANTGDVLANVSASMMYGQVLRYGYVMEKTVTTDNYTRYTPDFRGGERFTSSLRRTTKKRVKASPFGFGVDWDGFDAYQLSILAALGMSRR